MKKEIREEYERYARLGWALDGVSKNGHYRLVHADYGGELWLPYSPSDHRWKANSRSTCAKAMGMELRDVNIAMGEDYPVHEAKVRKERRRRKRTTAKSPAIVAAPKREPQVTKAGGSPKVTDDAAEKPVDQVRASWEEAQAEIAAAKPRIELPWKDKERA